MRYPQPTKPRSLKDVAKWFDDRKKTRETLLEMTSDLAKLQRAEIQTPEAEKHHQKIQDQKEEILEIINLLAALENVRVVRATGDPDAADTASSNPPQGAFMGDKK